MKVKIETIERHTSILTVEEITTLKKCQDLFRQVRNLIPLDEDVEEISYRMDNIFASISNNSIPLSEDVIKEEAVEREVL